MHVEKNLDLIIENYIAEHTDDISPLLQHLLKETEAITGRSRWSIGQVEGKLMQFLIKISGTRSAVEIGTFTGFSALMIAEALPDDGVLITCESNKEFAEIAQRYIEKSPYGRKIRLELKPAMQTLKEIVDNSVDLSMPTNLPTAITLTKPCEYCVQAVSFSWIMCSGEIKYSSER